MATNPYVNGQLPDSKIVSENGVSGGQRGQLLPDDGDDDDGHDDDDG